MGKQTSGKPVGSVGVPLGDKVINPIVFRLKNSRGEGDYFDGIPATCQAEDELTKELGNIENSLKKALHVINFGRCSSKKRSRQVKGKG